MSHYISIEMKLKEVSVEAIEMVINRLSKENKRIIFSQLTGDISKDKIDITKLKDKTKFIMRFIEKKDGSYFLIENGMDYSFHLTKDDKGYKWVKSGEIYFGIHINDVYIKYIDDPEDSDYKERKKERDEDTSKFLNILKIIYETLKPEYGWGDSDLNMESRGFDMKDISRPIIIYSPEQVRKIGEKRFEKLPVHTKIKCSDGGYILLIENIGHYNPEIREKIKKQLFG